VKVISDAPQATPLAAASVPVKPPKSARQAAPKPAPAAKTLSVPTEAKKLSDGRCASILERIQLGETLSDEEQAYVRQKCE
jgi:ribosome assembly protein YihI (activator of Der GTPase)